MYPKANDGFIYLPNNSDKNDELVLHTNKCKFLTLFFGNEMIVNACQLLVLVIFTTMVQSD